VRLEPPSPILELHEVTLASVASHAHGYLARPARPGRFPALVLFEHAGLHPLLRETALERAAEGWLAFNVSAHDAAPDAVADVPAAYESVGSTSRDTSYFLEMYLRAARAIDYIVSRDDWDGRTIVVMGTSMGGQQALAAAALNRRVSMVLVNEPSGADSNGPLHGRQAGYPNWSTDNPLIMRAALYFDIVNLAPRITAPTVVAIGFVDQTAPPAGIWAAFNQIVASKEVIAMTESDHDTPEKQEAWTARSSDLLSAIRHDLPIRLRSVE
jgi:cephalosporin-C deacetylase-like acetyl esterase